MDLGGAASVDQLMLVTAGVRRLPVSGPRETSGEGRRWPEGVCAGALKEGPRGEAAFAGRTWGRARRVLSPEVAFGDPDSSVTSRSLEGGRAQRGRPCGEGLRARAAPGAPCPGLFQHRL